MEKTLNKGKRVLGFLGMRKLWEGDQDGYGKYGLLIGFVMQIKVVSWIDLFLVSETQVTLQIEIYVLILAR